MRPSKNLENKTPSDTYKWVQIVCMKVEVYGSLELPLEYNQDQIPLMNQGSLCPFKPSWEFQKYYAVSDYF